MIDTSYPDLIAETRQICLKHNLWDGFSPIVTAVSGGMDSMVLLHVLNCIAREPSRNIIVAHFDHAGRIGTADDALFVVEYCKTLQIRCVTDRCTQQRPAGISPEAHWRRQRYRFLENVRQNCGAAAIATAHTADDQAETVLLRLLTGTGPRGLGGMKMHNRTHIVRPFLLTHRSRISQYAEESNIAWREDPSNTNLKYPRNALRHKVVPEVEKISSSYRERIQSLLDLLQGEDDYMSETAHRLLEQAGWKGTVPSRFSLTGFTGEHPALLNRAALSLYSAVDPAGDLRMTRDHVRRLAEVLSGTRKTLRLPNGFIIRSLQKMLVIFRYETLRNLPETPREIPAEGGVEFGPFRFSISPAQDICGTITMEPCVYLMEDDGLCRLRRRMPGDRFFPSGETRALALKTYFTRRYIPAEIRDQVPVVVNCRDEIIGLILPEGFPDQPDRPQLRPFRKLTWRVD